MCVCVCVCVYIYSFSFFKIHFSGFVDCISIRDLFKIMPLSHDRIFASVRRRMGTRRIS